MKSELPILLLAVLVAPVFTDIYFHNPRGSNNRLDEKTAARQNNNRLFDSQNNNKGGYNVGDLGSQPANGQEDKQYQIRYFQSGKNNPSFLELEWTMQHGCGLSRTGVSEVNCQVVIQYMCQDQTTDKNYRFRDGTTTASQQFTAVANGKSETEAEMKARRNGDVAENRGLNENWEWYDSCNRRERNRGLFTADVNLCKNGVCDTPATSTRQNPNGGRSGYECPEERDYYPYWHPTPWTDIAVLPTNEQRCRFYMKESFNVKPKHLCVEYYPGGNIRKHWSRWNNQRDCTANGGKWLAFYSYLEKAPEYKNTADCVRQKTIFGINYVWGLAFDGDARTEECLIPPEPLKCYRAPWTRANHLGNGLDGRTSHFTWRLPFFPSGRNKTCVLRARYNISSWDYNPYTTDWTKNLNRTTGTVSPIRKNPQVKVSGVPLRLAINTQQTGRTFQDRSHTFWLNSRPEALTNLRILNLNVRGKRGNIVQAFPAVEYDFVPTNLVMRTGDVVHIQWTGSNTHNNNGAGAAGEGTAGTDRHNFVPLDNLGENYPEIFSQSHLWKNVEVVWSPHTSTSRKIIDLAIELASSGYYRCVNQTTCPLADKNFVFSSKAEKLDPVLNNAPASFPGVVIRLKAGTYYYMCTRNNNFSNRSQKGSLVVTRYA